MTSSHRAPATTPPARRTVLIAGAAGQLGSDLARLATATGTQVLAYASADLDITDATAVQAAVARAAAADPQVVVINAAAYTGVDAAESDRDRAFAVNAVGPAHLAASTAAVGVRLVHVSTDYVFPGDGTRPYAVDDPTGPLGVYGASKLAGEQAVLAGNSRGQVVRTSWLYGANGANFVRTMVRLALGDGVVTVVDDQRGAPTHSEDLAVGLLQLAGPAPGTAPGAASDARTTPDVTAPDLRVLHGTSSGETTWFQFARTVFAAVGADPERVQPISSAARPSPAARPAYSVLSNASWLAAGLSPLPHWEQAFERAFAEHRVALGAPPAHASGR